jgi:hypothetical protein
MGLLMKTSVSGLKAHISDQDIERVTGSTRALFVAILTRALRDILKPTYSDYDTYKKQALHWIEINDMESFTSFVNICSYLDMNVDRVRRCVYIELEKIELGMQSKSSVKMIARGHCHGNQRIT